MGQPNNLITVDNPEIFAVSVAQNPGLMAPAINCQIYPHQATTDVTWLDYDPPPLTLTIGGVSYACLPQESSVEIDPDGSGVSIEVQYYPAILLKLQNAGLKKTLVFLSCQAHEFDLLKDEYDPDKFEVLHKPCDIYVSNGWTVNEIITTLGSRAGVPITVLFPTFHVPTPTVIFKQGQQFLPFIRSLLPSDFEYAWSLWQNKLTVSLIQAVAGQDVKFIDGVHKMVIARRGVPEYDFVEIRGGVNKYGTVIAFGEEFFGSSSMYPDGKILDEQLPPEEKEGADGIETYHVTRKFKTGPDGKEIFCLLERTTKVIGSYLRKPDTQERITTTLRETAEVYTYENDTPLIYTQPRQIGIQTTSKLIYTRVARSKVEGSLQTYWLTDDSRVLSREEYNKLPIAEQADVIFSAYHAYGEVAEQTDETFSWVTPEEADRNWFEGTQVDNSVQVQHRFFTVNGVYYDALLSPKEVLQQILTDLSMQSTDSPTITAWGGDALRTAELTVKKIELLSDGAFQQVETHSIFDTKAGSTTQKTTRQTINGKPPGSPSQYRTEQMVATLKKSSTLPWGEGSDLCVPFTAEIPTNNPEDFKLWAAMLWEQVSTKAKDVSMISFNRLLPMGSHVSGVTMTSFQASQAEDGTQSVVMGGV